MMGNVYRFQFKDGVQPRAATGALHEAIERVEDNTPSGQVRLDCHVYFNEKARVYIIDKSTKVGRDIALNFTSIATRWFGEGSFRVDHLARQTLAKTLTPEFTAVQKLLKKGMNIPRRSR